MCSSDLVSWPSFAVSPTPAWSERTGGRPWSPSSLATIRRLSSNVWSPWLFDAGWLCGERLRRLDLGDRQGIDIEGREVRFMGKLGDYEDVCLALSDKKAQDIVVLNLGGAGTLADVL